jgi:serine/threonine protein phosphatase PrpC
MVDFEYGPGEDAKPIWTMLSATNGLIGVFDGLGGAGGEIIRFTDGTERTSAWIASRLVRDIVVRVYYQVMQDTSEAYESAAELHDLRASLDFTAELYRIIKEQLREYSARMRLINASRRLKSRLIKTLPTTMAVARFDLTKNKFTAIWAGDSRIYCLKPDVGLLQVTTDDLKSRADALVNLVEDSPMSNCVNADTEFVLHERELAFQPCSILIAATDGCFGYVRTPLHFEHLLLSTMRDSSDWGDWQKKLSKRIKAMTGDDATLSAVAIGWHDFASCRSHYAKRLEWCDKRIQAYDLKYQSSERLQRELDEARKDLAEAQRTLWEEYRKTYESLIHIPARDIPGRRAEEQADSSGAEPRQTEEATLAGQDARPGEGSTDYGESG